MDSIWTESILCGTQYAACVQTNCTLIVESLSCITLHQATQWLSKAAAAAGAAHHTVQGMTSASNAQAMCRSRCVKMQQNVHKIVCSPWHVPWCHASRVNRNRHTHVCHARSPLLNNSSRSLDHHGDIMMIDSTPPLPIHCTCRRLRVGGSNT